MALLTSGYLTYDELMEYQKLPDAARMKQGPVAVIECVQEIPCNPCESACPRHAIHVGEPITNLPELEEQRCTGCGLCVAKCSGMAIFIVDKSYSDTLASVGFPYEYEPLPKPGMSVDAVNRAGKTVCRGVIKKVQMPPSFDHTAVVTVEVPIEFADEVRSIRREVQ